MIKVIFSFGYSILVVVLLGMAAENCGVQESKRY
jgi:hypothetical protein